MVLQVKPQWCQMWLNAVAVTDDLNALSFRSAHLSSALWPIELCIRYRGYRQGMQA